MIKLAFEYSRDLDDRTNFAAFINVNFGTKLTSEDVKDLIPMEIDDPEYNTEIVIDLEAGGEQTLRYNRVDFNTLVDKDYLTGVENPALLRKAFERQLGITVGPRDLGIDASKRSEGILGVTMLGSLSLMGSRTFRLHPTLSKVMRAMVGEIQIMPVGLSTELVDFGAALPYITVVTASSAALEGYTEHSGSVTLDETFEGLVLGFNKVTATKDTPLTRYGFDTLTSNFIFEAVVSCNENLVGSGTLSLALGEHSVEFTITEEFMSIGSASYPVVHDELINLKCIGSASSADLQFLINDKLVNVVHVNNLPKQRGEGLGFASVNLTGLNVFSYGVKRY